MWFVSLTPAGRVPIGIYDHPAPAGCSPPLGSIEVANIGVIPLLEGITSLRDYFERLGRNLFG